MVIDTGTRHLQSVYEVLHGKVNDVIICREQGTDSMSYTTVWVVKEHGLARELLQCFHEAGWENAGGYPEGFSMGGNFCFTFPYYQERPLFHFYQQEGLTREKRNRIWLDLIVTCMTCGLPFPVLYLILSQEQIQLESDGRIRLQYIVNLEGFDAQLGESDCATAGAELLLLLLEEEKGRNFWGYDLLYHKLSKEKYAAFIDLYKDMKLVIPDRKRKNLLREIGSRCRAHKDQIFRLLFGIGIGLAVLAVFMLVSQIIFGEIPLLRLFSDSFQVIGTESMKGL